MTLTEDLNDLLASGDKVTPAEYEAFRVRVEEAEKAGRDSGNVNYPRLVDEAFARVVVTTDSFARLPEVEPPAPVEEPPAPVAEELPPQAEDSVNVSTPEPIQEVAP